MWCGQWLCVPSDFPLTWGRIQGFDRLSWYCFDDSNVIPWNDQWVQRMEPYLVVYTKWDEQDEERTFAGRPSFTSGDLCQAVMKMDNKRCSL